MHETCSKTEEAERQARQQPEPHFSELAKANGLAACRISRQLSSPPGEAIGVFNEALKTCVMLQTGEAERESRNWAARRQRTATCISRSGEQAPLSLHPPSFLNDPLAYLMLLGALRAAQPAPRRRPG